MRTVGRRRGARRTNDGRIWFFADRITGGAGADAVEAGPGDDIVRACDDTKDVLRGQRGVDKVFRDPVDVITGFERRSAC